MNLNYLYRQLRKRKNLKHYEIKPIGSAIRLKRKEMGMTLEEGAEGICSISYLSKLENNQIDPNLDFVDKLVERFDLKEQIDFDVEKYENDIEELTDLMINLEKPKRCYIDSYRDREDHQARIIDLIESTLNENYTILSDHYRVIQQFIPNLKETELKLVILCLCESLIHSERYIEAYALICEIPLAHKEQYDYYLLTLRMRLRLSFLMHKFADIGLYYQHYIAEVDAQGYDHLSREMKRSKLLHLAYYQVPHVIKDLEHVMDRHNQLEHLPYAVSCFSHHRFDEVIELSRTRESLSGWLVYYLVSLEAKEKIDEIKHVIEAKIPEKVTPSEQIMIKHMRTKYIDETHDILAYLRKDVIGNRIASDHPLLLEYLVMDTTRIFARHQFYKEANLVINMYQPRFKSLRIA